MLDNRLRQLESFNSLSESRIFSLYLGHAHTHDKAKAWQTRNTCHALWMLVKISFTTLKDKLDKHFSISVKIKLVNCKCNYAKRKHLSIVAHCSNSKIKITTASAAFIVAPWLLVAES